MITYGPEREQNNNESRLSGACNYYIIMGNKLEAAWHFIKATDA